MTGLTNGTTYTFTVRSLRHDEISPPSSPSAPVVPGPLAATVPGAPRNVVAEPGHQEVTVRFTAPFNTGGAAITAYRVTANPGGASVVGSASPLTVTGLNNGTEYTFTVNAINRIGAGPASVASNAVTPSAVIGAPRNLMIVAKSSDSVTLDWEQTNSALPLEAYRIEVGYAPGQTAMSFLFSAGATRRAFERVPAGAYYVRVRAEVYVPVRTVSAPSNEIVVLINHAALPAAPRKFLGLADGNRLALAWVNSARYGEISRIDLAVTGFNANGAFATVIPLPPSAESFSFSGVPPGSYRFEVYAVNVFGRSAPSPSVALAFPAACSGVPQAPTYLRFNNSGFVLRVSWETPEHGPTPTAYTVNVSGTAAGTFATPQRELSGVISPGTYQLSVTASNSCGTGATTPTLVLTCAHAVFGDTVVGVVCRERR